MALWKNEPDNAPTPTNQPAARAPQVTIPQQQQPSAPERRSTAAAGESIIAAGIVIEGKIEGKGHVRIAGQFNGDVHVEGNLTIDSGAKVTGGVRADRVSIAGELEGNIEAATAVEIAATGVLNGDLKAGSLTVAAGSRMRGKVEFGWSERGTSSKPAPAPSTANTSAKPGSAATA